MKILIADFDKTLFTLNYEENVNAINDFIARGNKFILATGRNLNSLMPDLNPELQMSYIICNDGGIIFDENFKVIYRKDVIKEVVEPIYDYLKKCPYVGNPLIDTMTKYSNVPELHTNAIIARIIDREKSKETLKELLDKYPAISAYISDRWLNIGDQSVNKGNALKNICYILKYDYKDVYAIGDNQNDIPMCQICNGFAVEDSSKELRDVSKGIVKDIKELVEML